MTKDDQNEGYSLHMTLNQTKLFCSRLTLKDSALTIFVINLDNSTEVLRNIYFYAARKILLFLKDSINWQHEYRK